MEKILPAAQSLPKNPGRHLWQRRAEGVPELLGQAKQRNSPRSLSAQQKNPTATAKLHFRWIFE